MIGHVSLGQLVSLTANLTPTSATGTVAFMDGSTVSGVSTCTASFATSGTHTIIETNVTVLPETVQTAGLFDVNMTALPEVPLVAERASVLADSKV
jgi:hypothetical protein